VTLKNSARQAQAAVRLPVVDPLPRRAFFGLSVPSERGHIDPAVTIALASMRRFPWSDVVPYFVAQLVGGFVGALAHRHVRREGRRDYRPPGRDGARAGRALRPGHAREAGGTFILMLIIMALAVDKRAPAGWAGLMIGLVLGGVIMALGPATRRLAQPGPHLRPLSR
jgi:glycerol uptake facilitator protein